MHKQTNTGDFVAELQVKADGSVVEKRMQWDGNNEREIQGMRMKGFYVPLPSAFMGITAMTGIPSGAKFFTIITQTYDNYGMDYSSQTYKWGATSAGRGGHPQQYVIKNGKMYYGVIGQDEEYFFSEGFEKQ